MLYREVELRLQRRKKNVVVLPVLNWTVTSRRRYGGQIMNQGGRHDTKQFTKEKKKNNETRSGASWEEPALEIEGTVLK